MAKSYKTYLPEQSLLLPPSLREWLPDDHLAFFVSDLVDVLDLSAITSVYERDDRGQPPYHPAMMTKVLVYGYCTGVFSSRRIARRLVDDVAFRVLAAGNTPDFRTIADFRKIHLAALEGLFVQVLQMAREAGAVSVGRVAIDGSKVKANASKHQAMSYGRMQEREATLATEVHHLLTQAEATDAQEDATHGRDRRGDELPPELQRRETRLARIREAKRVLEARAKAEAAPAEQSDAVPDPNYGECRVMGSCGGDRDLPERSAGRGDRRLPISDYSDSSQAMRPDGKRRRRPGTAWGPPAPASACRFISRSAWTYTSVDVRST